MPKNRLFCCGSDTKFSYNKMMHNIKPVFTLLIACFFLIGTITPAFAQSGYLEDNGDYLWEEQQYHDTTGREFETSDSQYVGEQEIKQAEEAAIRAGRPSIDLAAALEKDKELLPDNIIYGIGTGAVIGGWLALVQGQNARDNVRFLSVGIISGLLLGMAVGSKSLYINEGTPVSRLDRSKHPEKATPQKLPIRFGFVRKNNQTRPQLSLNLKF